MDRISALRNIEQALQQFDAGEIHLAEAERRIQTILRTYATEYEGENAVFQAHGDPAVDGRVIVAPTEAAARDRLRALVDADDPTFELERV